MSARSADSSPHNYTSRNYTGNNYTGNNYRGNNYTGNNDRGHDDIGHNRTDLCDPRVGDVRGLVAADSLEPPRVDRLIVTAAHDDAVEPCCHNYLTIIANYWS